MGLIILDSDNAASALDGMTPGTEEWARELVAQQFLSRWTSEATAAGFADCAPCLEREPRLSIDRFAMAGLLPTTSNQMTQGSHPRTEYRGYSWIKIWTPACEGQQGGARLADCARRIFNRKQLTSSPFVEAMIIETGNTSQTAVDGRWFMQAIMFPSRWYEQAAVA